MVRARLGRVRRAAVRLGHGRISPARLIDQLPGQRRRSSPAVVALTFDDGPHPEVTPALLDLLESEGVPATFFMCGLNAQRHPELVRAVADAGHRIGGHTWDHRALQDLSESDWWLQIERTHGLLADLSGQRIRLVRPPYGILGQRCLRRLRAEGLIPVGASAVGLDWVETDPDAIAARIASRLEPGAIVVLHDACGDLLRPGGTLPEGTHADRWPGVAAVPGILAAARRRGLEQIVLPLPP